MNRTMKNGVGTATRILCGNTAVAASALVAQVGFLVVRGPSHPYWPLYLVLMGLLVASSLTAIFLVRISLWWGMQLYAWVCLACIIGMVCVDAMFLNDGYPLVLFTMILGVVGLGATLGYGAMVPYATVCVLIMLGAGIVYGRMDTAVVGAALSVAIGHTASVGASNIKRLDEAENERDQMKEAIAEYVNAGQEQRRIRSRRSA